VSGAVPLLPLYYFLTCTEKKNTFTQRLYTILEKKDDTRIHKVTAKKTKERRLTGRASLTPQAN
jgi:hypothetical protein